MLVLFSFCSPAIMAIDSFELPDDPVTLKRYQVLSEEFRCLVCQNQNLADSNAELAKDLKIELVNLLESGRSDDEIRAFLVDRYGDFVLYRPPVKSATLVLWLAPLIGVVVIGLVLLMFWRRARVEDDAIPANEAELTAALDRLRSQSHNASSDK